MCLIYQTKQSRIRSDDIGESGLRQTAVRPKKGTLHTPRQKTSKEHAITIKSLTYCRTHDARCLYGLERVQAGPTATRRTQPPRVVYPPLFGGIRPY